MKMNFTSTQLHMKYSNVHAHLLLVHVIGDPTFIYNGIEDTHKLPCLYFHQQKVYYQVM